jgi:hypothetical protein
MSSTQGKSETPGIRRREFIRIGIEAAAAFTALSAASSLVAGCGGGEETAAPAPSAAPAAPAAPPAAAPAPAPAAEPAPAAPAAAGGKPLVTDVPAMAPTVQALQYTHKSAKPDQHCSNCMFYTAEGGALGKCQLFAQGYVEEGGWCMSWAAKPPSSPS